MRSTSFVIAASVMAVLCGCTDKSKSAASVASAPPVHQSSSEGSTSPIQAVPVAVVDTWNSKFEIVKAPTQYANAEPPKVHPDFEKKPIRQVESVVTYSQDTTPIAPNVIPSQPASQSAEAPKDNFNPDRCVFKSLTSPIQATLEAEGRGEKFRFSKMLADAAKEECLSTRGQLGPAYQRWKDEMDVERAKTNRLIESNQRLIESNRAINCRPDGLGGMRCQ